MPSFHGAPDEQILYNVNAVNYLVFVVNDAVAELRNNEQHARKLRDYPPKCQTSLQGSRAKRHNDYQRHRKADLFTPQNGEIRNQEAKRRRHGDPTLLHKGRAPKPLQASRIASRIACRPHNQIAREIQRGMRRLESLPQPWAGGGKRAARILAPAIVFLSFLSASSA